MKRYIHSSESQLSIRDLFDSISSIILVPDADKVVLDTEYDREKYDEYTDEELMSLSDDEIEDIGDPGVLSRLRSLIPDRFSSITSATIGDLLAEKYSLKESDIRYILEKISKCSSVSRTLDGYFTKTDRFIRRYRLTDRDILHIARSLTINDFDHYTKSYSPENMSNDLIVFILKRPIEIESGDTLEGLKVYMKIDYTATSRDGDTVALMSLHKADLDKLEKSKDAVYQEGKIKLNR